MNNKELRMCVCVCVYTRISCVCDGRLFLSGTVVTFHNSNQILIKNCSIATVVSQHVCHLSHHLGFFNNFILYKIAADFTEFSRKYEFAASNRNIIENKVKKKKLEQVFPKIYSFLFRTLICIINYT